MDVNVTILSPQARDNKGNPTGVSVLTSSEHWKIAPQEGVEVDDRNREGAVILLTGYAPAGTRLAHDSKVRIDAAPFAGLYIVETEPGVWQNPRSNSEAGVTVALRRAEG